MLSRRGRVLSLFALAAVGAAAACLPDPEGDFKDYQDRIKSYASPAGDSGPVAQVDAGPPPAEAVEGVYFASCLSELANGQVKKAFSFWATTKFTPNADKTGGEIDITLGALKLVDGLPPTTLSPSNIVSTITGITGTVDATNSFVAALPAGTQGRFDGSANPISGSNVAISNAGLKGKFIPAGFCARLTGHVDEPAPASRDLDEDKNVCLFTPVKDGDTAPTRVFSDYNVANCPL
jgi:hypothetical protein